MKKNIISTLLSLSIITSLNVSADNTIGMSLGGSETVGTSSLSTVFGDVNQDGTCNVLDTIALKSYLIEDKENPLYNYDINQNGSIDKFDLYNLKQIITGEAKTLEDIPLYYRIDDNEVETYKSNPEAVFYQEYMYELEVLVPIECDELSIEDLGLDKNIVTYLKYDCSGILIKNGDIINFQQYTLTLKNNDIDNIIKVIISAENNYPNLISISPFGNFNWVTT